MMLTPGFFFDLSEFSHAQLFDSCNFAWEALSHLSAYLSKCSLGKIHSKIPKGAFLSEQEKIYIGKNVTIEPGCYISGPCWIGDGSTIRHGAYIRGNVITGINCVIGHDTELKNAIFLNHTNAAHFAYVGDSILGNRVNLGAGVKCANLKLDHSEVTIEYQGEKIHTGMKKLGAIIGDGTQIGCNSVTNPGTLCGQEVLCYPLVNLSGVVKSSRRVKR